LERKYNKILLFSLINKIFDRLSGFYVITMKIKLSLFTPIEQEIEIDKR
jgi:hypothetical protein